MIRHRARTPAVLLTRVKVLVLLLATSAAAKGLRRLFETLEKTRRSPRS
jgi:hypothetical protein